MSVFFQMVRSLLHGDDVLRDSPLHLRAVHGRTRGSLHRRASIHHHVHRGHHHQRPPKEDSSTPARHIKKLELFAGVDEIFGPY